jgi:methylenetetrahydrofolate dehydrogenase (NADP+) / methenyltetrahydrofolate cyclohydrolase
LAEARLIDGKGVAKSIREMVANDVGRLAASGIEVTLAVVLVGDDPASAIYVRNKRRACKRAKIQSIHHTLPSHTPTSELLALVGELNRDQSVHGILVQVPLPPHIDSDAIIQAVDPRKDVDGFHPENLGLLLSGSPRLVACTPLGIMQLLATYEVPLAGARAVVIGRSRTVGRPLAALLTNAHATVTICHSRTRNLAAIAREADILVAAVGKPELVRGDWIRPGAVVIDVGIHRDEQRGLLGDVCFAEAAKVAGAITPVPGGVGPMTIATLLQNTVLAAERTATSETKAA